MITTQEHLAVQVLDLSMKGALLRLPDACVVVLGSPCLLKVVLSDKESRIAMAGEVTHIEGHRAGMLCRSIDIESVTHLRRLIQMNLGDASLVERELGAMISSE